MDRLPFIFPFADPPPQMVPSCFPMDSGGLASFSGSKESGTGSWIVPPLMSSQCFLPYQSRGYPGNLNYQGMHADQRRKRSFLECQTSENQHFENLRRISPTANNQFLPKVPDNLQFPPNVLYPVWTSENQHFENSRRISPSSNNQFLPKVPDNLQFPPNVLYPPPALKLATNRPSHSSFGFFDRTRYGSPISSVTTRRTIFPNQPRFYLNNEMKDYGFFKKDNFWHSKFRPVRISVSSSFRGVQNITRGGKPYVPIYPVKVKPFYIIGSRVAGYDSKDSWKTNDEPHSKKQCVKEDEDIRYVINDLLDHVDDDIRNVINDLLDLVCTNC